MNHDVNHKVAKGDDEDNAIYISSSDEETRQPGTELELESLVR